MSPLLPPPVSLLLLIRVEAPGPGTGGARPREVLPRPGMAGAPPTGGLSEAPDGFPTMGADRSFVTAFFSLAPLVISVRRSPFFKLSVSVTFHGNSINSLLEAEYALLHVLYSWLLLAAA